jgi:hypothetical protein
MELMERILTQRASLEDLLSPITAQEMEVVHGDWSIKDHLAHLNAWCGKAVAVLTGRPAYTGLGLIRPPDNPRDYDSINAIIHARDQSLPLEEVVATSGQRHSEILAALFMVSDADLRQPVPPDEPDGPTVLALVANNTYEHSIEHEAYIREALGL